MPTSTPWLQSNNLVPNGCRTPPRPSIDAIERLSPDYEPSLDDLRYQPLRGLILEHIKMIYRVLDYHTHQELLKTSLALPMEYIAWAIKMVKMGLYLQCKSQNTPPE